MKRYFFTILISICIVFVQAQSSLTIDSYSGQPEISASRQIILKPGFTVAKGQNLRVYIKSNNPETTILSSTPSTNKNFVLERNYKTPGVKLNNLSLRRNLAEENQNVTYYDNWGREIQNINIMGSVNYTDMVTPIYYDKAGRNSTTYLPYSENNSANGSYIPNDINNQQKYYSKESWDPFVSVSQAPFRTKVFDNSPQDKVIEEGEEGVAWQPNGHSVRFDKKLNNNIGFSDISKSRKARKFSVIASNQNEYDISSLQISSGVNYYEDRELIVNIVKNNNWTTADGRLNTSEEYVDKSGQKVLTRSFVVDEGGNQKILSTYYIYSDYGDLCFILPPALNPDESEITTAGIDLYGYRYVYDKKGRLSQEKGPGKNPDYYVYNKNNQLVASQDPNQRVKNQWSFRKYDSQGREIISGVISSLLSYADIANEISAISIVSENRTYATGIGYSNNAWPKKDIVSYSVLLFYDNYEVIGIPDKLSFDASIAASKVDYPSNSLTISKVFTDQNVALWKVNYYDEEGKLIQAQSSNHLGGRDLLNNKYNFNGDLVQSERKHFDANNNQKLIIINTPEYDQISRLVKIKQKINNQDEITLSSFLYNDIGQLIDKKLHQKQGQDKYLQSIDYRYNERGWLTSINDPDLSLSSLMNDNDTDSNPDLFGLKLFYQDDAVSPQYNGNISTSKWKTSKLSSQTVAPPKMGYQYRYDKLDRLINAITEKDDKIDNSHDESITYDVNGNILNLNRKAYTSGSIQVIDDLKYTYDGYKTKKLDDDVNSAHKHLGYNDKAKLVQEYFYDPNGNMIDDKNKAIKLEYTDRNLIKKITFGGVTNHKLEFLYDRIGTKLQAKYTNANGIYTIDYLDDIQYEQGKIAFIQTPEGRARLNGSTYDYEYDIKDHIGNTRVTFKPDPSDVSQTKAQVIQQNSYYPYGMPMYGDAANNLHLAYVSGEKNKYLYSGKELYDQGELNWFDHGSRMYDPAVGRWFAMDPAKQFVNPYLAMGNNPVIGVDPNGEFWHIVIGAAIGGVVNTISHWEQVKSGGLSAGLKAFGVGAVAGAVTAGTGGAAAAGFSAGSVAGAVAGGAVGTMYGDNILGLGNMIAFGEKYDPSPTKVATAGIIGGVTGGLFQGLSNSISGRNFWTGLRKGEAYADYIINEGVANSQGQTSGDRFLIRNPVNQEVNPNTLIRTEAGRSWTRSTKNVAKIMNTAKTTGITEPVEVFLHNGKTYIINGHHRVHAAIRLGQKVPVKYLTSPGKFVNVFELQNAAYRASLQSFPVDGRLLNTLLK